MIRTLTPHVRYIGVDDLTLDLFEGQYALPEGMAYNSYLIEDEKIAVMDTADGRVGAQWLAQLEEALAGREPDYLVVHHMEPDHSALVARLLAQYPGLKAVASAKAIQLLGQFFPEADLSGRTLAVKEGDVLSLGAVELRFLSAPMVHWPEVMVSFLPQEGLLFSADAFGKFGALSQCGFSGADDGDWACEARRYYFNICGKYGLPVQTLLRKVASLPVKAILPLHGPVLLENLEQYVGLYQTWSSYGVETPGVFVAYASIHGGTAAVAERFAQMLRERGVPKVAMADLCRDDSAEAVEDAFRYGTLVVAASSYDGGLFPPAHAFIHHLQDKAWQKRRVALIENGSWAPSAGRVMREMFSAMKDVRILEPVVTIRSVLLEEDLPALAALADAVAGAGNPA